MKQICKCCNQVLPETQEEKRLATEKTALARQMLKEAGDSWGSFFRPKKPLMSDVVGDAIGIGFALVFFFGSSSAFPMMTWAQGILILAGTILIGAAGIWFLSFKPAKEIWTEELAAKKRFLEKFKTHAETLGFAAD